MSTLKKARILSTGAVQKVIDKEKPGYRVVELAPEALESRDLAHEKSTRTLPSLVKLRKAAISFDAEAESSAGPESEEALWGNSSQFALVEPKDSTSGDDPVRRRRTVIVSHGKVITEQG